MEDYQPYGEEWKKEMMKNKKSKILDICSAALQQKDREIEELSRKVQTYESHNIRIADKKIHEDMMAIAHKYNDHQDLALLHQLLYSRKDVCMKYNSIKNDQESSGFIDLFKQFNKEIKAAFRL